MTSVAIVLVAPSFRVAVTKSVVIRIVFVFGLVSDFGSGEIFLPMVRPVVGLVGNLARRFRVSAHVHAVDEAAGQRQEAEHQENDAQNPATNQTKLFDQPSLLRCAVR